MENVIPLCQFLISKSPKTFWSNKKVLGCPSRMSSQRIQIASLETRVLDSTFPGLNGADPTEFFALKHESRILGHSSNSVCGFSMMEHVRFYAVWPMQNWPGSTLNQIQGWTTVRESCSRVLEQRPLRSDLSSWLCCRILANKRFAFTWPMVRFLPPHWPSCERQRRCFQCCA